MRALLAANALVGALTFAPHARGQSGAEEATRTALIAEAREAHRVNDHARAVDLATRAGAIRWTGTLRGFVAREQVALGRLADALGNAELCAREAPAETPSPSRDAILDWCRAQVTELRPQLGQVIVQATSSPDGLRVRVDGHALRAALLGVPYLVTPGLIAVEADAPGHRPYRRAFEVARGATVTVPLALEQATAAPAPVVRVTTTRTVRSPLGPVLMGVGAAAAVTGLVLWLVATERYNDLDGRCRERCLQGEIDREYGPIDDLDRAAIVTGYGGLGIAAAGAVLFFVLTRREAVVAPPRVSLQVGPGALGLAGTF